MTAECDRLPERFDKVLAIGAGAEMAAEFCADIRWEFIIDVGGQLPKNVQATAFPRLVAVG